MRKELKSVLDNINKKFGINAVRSASDLEDVKWRIPSGSISLDIALGGGIPVGRMIQISGGFSACKSALAYHIAANAQKMKKKKVLWEKYSTKDKPVYRWIITDKDDPEGVPLSVAIIQSESHSYTNDWASAIGINIKDLAFVTPEGMEEGLEIASYLQQSGEVDVIIHDSYAAYKPIKVLDKSMNDSVQMGIKPQLFDEYHGKFHAFNNRAEREGRIPTTLIAINQLREYL